MEYNIANIRSTVLYVDTAGGGLFLSPFNMNIKFRLF